MGCVLREALQKSAWEIVNTTPLPVVCFTREGLDVGAFLTELRKDQIAWMSETRINGTPVIRACITSYRTSDTDIASVVKHKPDRREPRIK